MYYDQAGQLAKNMFQAHMPAIGPLICASHSKHAHGSLHLQHIEPQRAC